MPVTRNFRRSVEAVVQPNYAASSHLHPDYAASSHVHPNYAASSHLHAGVYTPLPTWTAWTPTVTQSNSTTVTVTGAKFSVVGKVVHIYAFLTVTGSGTAANPIVIGNVPAAIAPVIQAVPIGPSELWDASAGVAYYGVARFVGASTMNFMRDGANQPVGQAPNVALEANDVIRLSGTYEIA